MEALISAITSCIPETAVDLPPDHSKLFEEYKYFKTLSRIEVTRIIINSILNKCCGIERHILCAVENGGLHKMNLDSRINFAPVCLIKVYVLLKLIYMDFDSRRSKLLIDAMAAIDIGLVVGLPINGWNIDKAADVLHEYLSKDESILAVNGNQIDGRLIGDNTFCNDSKACTQRLLITQTLPQAKKGVIPIEEAMSLETFLSYLNEKKPVKMLDGMNDWSAPIKWKYVGYLKRIAGFRTVPIESGNYLNDGRVQLITLSQYLDQLLEAKTVEDCGYLAQHQLLDQVERLKQDIIMPTYCCTTDVDEIISNVWIGPADTLTPIHTDPQPNILCQVVGRKSVVLYPPSNSCYLYPRTERFVNHSQVDIRNPDIERYPDYMKAEPMVCELKPGEMLFIPAGWWHAVEANDISISINFFF